MEQQITAHAYLRIKERLNIKNEKQAQRLVALALERGVQNNENLTFYNKVIKNVNNQQEDKK
jgi:hypothetical protein